MNKSFLTSKVFWVALLGFAAVVLNGQFGLNISNELIAGIIAILTIIFRWPSDKPLKLK